MPDHKITNSHNKIDQKNKNSNKSKKTRWLPSLVQLLSSVIIGIAVGIGVLIGQTYLQPKIAKEVKKEETILEQRYKACNDAFDTLLRKMEHASVTRGEVKYGPVPTSEKLTAIEINSISCRLALFSSGDSVPKKFVDLIDTNSVKIKDIAEFVLLLRNEMEIGGEGVEPNDFKFAYPTSEPISE